MPWKKSFDVDDALRRAGEAFWTHGYEATSMHDLLEAMGIQKGSFYGTYGCKKDAYLRSLEQYAERRFAELDGLAEGLAPKEALRALIEAIRDECLGPDGHRGCMLVNAALELAHSDVEAQRVVQRALEIHEQSFAERIRAAQAAGEVAPGLDAAAKAKSMLAMVLGMRVLARAGAPRATIRTLAEQALELLER